MIGIIEYGSGNIRAIGNIYDSLKISYKVIESAEQLNECSKIILPGVGAFDETIQKLDDSGFRSALDHHVLELKKPVLGICVGMQIMANSSDEGSKKGLGWIEGKVKKFDVNLIPNKPKIPHLGWNSINPTKDNPIFKAIDIQEGFYFIHSYYYECLNNLHQLSTTNYGIEFSSSIQKDNIFGVQFHPEKSHQNGITLLQNFANII
jgi:glutamine amidotransferase